MALFWLKGVKTLLIQQCFRDACRIAIPSASFAALLKVLDQHLQRDFMTEMMPDQSVCNGFNAIMGTLIVFRTVQSLAKYREGASLVYQIIGSWFDAASTLISFTRGAKAEKMVVDNFQHTVIRLFSLLNMLCMAELENKSSTARKQAASFDIIDTRGLALETLSVIKDAECRVEVVAQLIQSMIVDSMSTGILCVPPPILTRSFQDLGNGLLKFHTALNIAHVAIPLPYVALTEGLLAVHAVFTPAAMCVQTKGPVTAFLFTFVAVLLMWSFSYLASELDNPFGADSNDLPVTELQHELNERFQSLIQCSATPMPTIALGVTLEKHIPMMKVTTTIPRGQGLKYTMSEFFDRMCKQAESYQQATARPSVEVCDQADVRELGISFAEIAESWEENLGKIDSPRVLLLEQVQQREQKSAFPLKGQSLSQRGTIEEVHESVVLAALHMEERVSADDSPQLGHQPEPRLGASYVERQRLGALTVSPFNKTHWRPATQAPECELFEQADMRELNNSFADIAGSGEEKMSKIDCPRVLVLEHGEQREMESAFSIKAQSPSQRAATQGVHESVALEAIAGEGDHGGGGVCR